ncbi:MAG: tRNA (N(6)-L-threonylcarbamoyladenosine(37)-C(2))-methylthiotransferase MtaB [Armatimonadota bacterium]
MHHTDRDNPPRVALTTLGCKLNQYDTEVVREQFLRAGYQVVPFDQPADVYVVNSCTVTSRSDRDSRRLARQAKRRSPQATVVVTGCYAQTDALALADIPAIDLVVGNLEKAHLADLLADRARGVRVSRIDRQRRFDEPCVSAFGEHTRAFVKIQDGCDSACAYCIVPHARGPSRSRPPGDVLDQVRRLADAGYREVILVGVHLGAYGQDLDDDVCLADVAESLVEIENLSRLRLSSIEPREVDDRLIALARDCPKVCRHFHIPMQSGDDHVLARMNRPYTSAVFAELVERIAEQVPGCGLGADVLVGFPGETEAAFARTRHLLEGLPLTYLHVFSYSPRRGTPAALMPDQVQEELKKRRCRELRDLSQRKLATFCDGLVGQTLHILVEDRPGNDGPLTGLSDNYVRAHFDGPLEVVGHAVPVTVTGSANGAVAGRLLAKPRPD